jgi:hypothetical protein
MRERILVVKLAAICAALFSCLAHAAAAGAAPGPPSFTVRVLSANGSGCPPGSLLRTAVVRQGSSLELTVTYSVFDAFAGDGVALGGFRENCQVNALVGVPSGWTFTVVAVDYRGYAHLGAGARGTLETSYYFSGLPTTVPLAHSLSGPEDGNFEFTDQVPLPAWAPCHFSATLNVSTSIRVYPGSDKSFLNMLALDSPDQDVGASYRLALERC